MNPPCPPARRGRDARAVRRARLRCGGVTPRRSARRSQAPWSRSRRPSTRPEVPAARPGRPPPLPDPCRSPGSGSRPRAPCPSVAELEPREAHRRDSAHGLRSPRSPPPTALGREPPAALTPDTSPRTSSKNARSNRRPPVIAEYGVQDAWPVVREDIKVVPMCSGTRRSARRICRSDRSTARSPAKARRFRGPKAWAASVVVGGSRRRTPARRHRRRGRPQT